MRILLLIAILALPLIALDFLICKLRGKKYFKPKS